jgi:hypothetical protein
MSAPAVAAGVRDEPEPEEEDLHHNDPGNDPHIDPDLHHHYDQVDEDDASTVNDAGLGNGIEDEEHVLVSDGDSTVSNNFNLSELDDGNFDDDLEPVDEQKAGVDDVEVPKAGVDDKKSRSE